MRGSLPFFFRFFFFLIFLIILSFFDFSIFSLFFVFFFSFCFFFLFSFPLRHFPVANLDAYRLGVDVARMFQKTGWSKRCTHELFTPPKLLGGLRCPAVIVNQQWSGQLKIAGGAARWTAVELGGQLTSICHTKERNWDNSKQKWEAQTTCDLGWRLQCEPGQFGSATCVSSHRLASFLMIAYIMTVSLTAVLWCL